MNIGKIIIPLSCILWLVGGCNSQIGDSCSINVDCSSLGDRICDTSQVGGYCTIEGCDVDSCPGEAVCIRFYPAGFLSTTCNPLTEDTMDPEVEPTNHCATNEICLSDGFCSLIAQERRFCMKTCSNDGDCRSEYECRKTGTRGAEAMPDPEKPGVLAIEQFCAQRP